MRVTRNCAHRIHVGKKGVASVGEHDDLRSRAQQIAKEANRIAANLQSVLRDLERLKGEVSTAIEGTAHRTDRQIASLLRGASELLDSSIGGLRSAERTSLAASREVP